MSGRGVKNMRNGGVEKEKKNNGDDGGNRKRQAEERWIGPTTNVIMSRGPFGDMCGRAQTSRATINKQKPIKWIEANDGPAVRSLNHHDATDDERHKRELDTVQSVD